MKEGEAEEVEEVQASVGEAFDPCNFGGLAEHVKTHNFPEHVRTCGPCKFWKHRWKWSLQASFKNPGTGNREEIKTLRICAPSRGAYSNKNIDKLDF